MSSKGPMVTGTDGTDFTHRQTVASHYAVSVANKSRLRFTNVMHYMLGALMLIKLTDEILDRLDIFILELQELYIPKPMLWEWIWFASLTLNLMASRAMKKNNDLLLKVYSISVIMFAIGPLCYSFAYHFRDFKTFVETRDLHQVSVWKGYPVALLWYVFLVVAFQIHLGQLFFSWNLIRAWMMKKQKKST